MLKGEYSPQRVQRTRRVLGTPSPLALFRRERGILENPPRGSHWGCPCKFACVVDTSPGWQMRFRRLWRRQGFCGGQLHPQDFIVGHAGVLVVSGGRDLNEFVGGCGQDALDT